MSDKSPSSSQNSEILGMLTEIQGEIARASTVEESLHVVLGLLSDRYNILSAAVLLLDEGVSQLLVIESIGFEHDVSKKGYRTDEGITGRIFQSGKPIILPQISQEPTFLNLLHAWNPDSSGEQTFIGVPLSHQNTVFGVFVVHLPYVTGRDYQQDLGFMTIVGQAIAIALHAQSAVAAERQKLLNENVILRQKLQNEYSFHNIIGNSHEMRDVYEQVARIAGTNTTVLLRGESGTGKELIAESIHYNSARRDKPFVRVNCAAIPETLIESEFFGHEKGAFTGAFARKPGRFELAHTGTIFLDEVAELSPMTQVKLLRVLQKQAFERVGGTETLSVDVRVIAATNSDLESLMADGRFRDDLYYRLNIFSIYLPSLRERKTDILLLADHFMLKYSRQHAKSVKRISTPAIDMLMRYHWPGNVRELENCIERAVLLCDDQVIHSYHLPPTLQTAESSNTLPKMSLKDAAGSYEKELIQDALKSARGNRARAARLLDTTGRILNYKIHRYGIDVSRFRA